MNPTSESRTAPAEASISERFATPITISTKPQPNPEVRRAGRLLAMVHELHKVGYQRLRICAGIGVDGRWRCLLTPADNVGNDGWTPIASNNLHVYSVGDEARYFDWDDAEGSDARTLATMFVERFQETARAAAGEDWAYAGWFALILGYAENGTLPAFFGRDGVIPTGYVSVNPPSTPECLNSAEERPSTGLDLILNEDLRIDHLPPPGADYDRLWPFCLSFDGYCVGLRTGEDCGVLADRVERAGLENATLEELRTTAFYRQRQIKWGDIWPPSAELIRSIHNVIEEIRSRLLQQPGGRTE